jgi:acetyl esterase/lipase
MAMKRSIGSGRQVAWQSALAVALTFAIAAAARAAGADDAARIKVIKDVAYGPHARNLMDLYLPEEQAGAAARPLIVCIHGGGWAGGDKRVYAWMGEGFARRGFVAASITYRFAPGSTAPAQIDDVQRAVRWLRKNAKTYGIDPERIGAIGGSAGGHLAACLGLMETRDNSDELAEYSSRVECVVDCYGPVDLAGMMKSASAPLVQGFVGKPLEGNEEAYRRASPVTYVGKGGPPFLIVHGTKDVGTARGQVPMEQSIEFHQKLKEAGAEATLLKLEGAGHGFTGDAANKHAQRTFEAAGEFFGRHLGKKG